MGTLLQGAWMREWITSLSPEPGPVPDPAGSRSTHAAMEAVLGSAPTAWVVQTAHRLAADAPSAALAGLHSVPEAERESLRRSFELGLLSLLRSLHTGRLPDEHDVLAETLEINRQAMRRGASLANVERSMWQISGRILQALLDELGRNASAFSFTEAMALATELNGRLVRHIEVCQRIFSDAWERDLEQWQEQTAAARRRAVRELLEPVSDPSAAERILGIRLRGHHLAVVSGEAAGNGTSFAAAVPGGDSNRQSARATELRQVLAPVCEDGGAQLTLTLLDGDTTAWLTFMSPPSTEVICRVRTALAGLWAGWATVGPVLPGADGFRRSHLLAARLARYARTHASQGRRLFDLETVRPASLLAEDQEFAGWFVRNTLGALASDRAKDRDLRETLLSYLVSGHSLRATAEQLHVAPNTVTYRVRQAQQLLPNGTDRDPLSVMLALALSLDLPGLLAPDPAA